MHVSPAARGYWMLCQSCQQNALQIAIIHRPGPLCVNAQRGVQHSLNTPAVYGGREGDRRTLQELQANPNISVSRLLVDLVVICEIPFVDDDHRAPCSFFDQARDVSILSGN